jgi:hypothetical protein
MKRFHCAVNFVSNNNVLVRVKELGNSAPSMKVNCKAWGDSVPVKGENFLAEISDECLQVGNYLIPSNFKVVEREFSEPPKPFNLAGAIAESLAADEEAVPFDIPVDGSPAA